jgi:hypothetical protein
VPNAWDCFLTVSGFEMFPISSNPTRNAWRLNLTAMKLAALSGAQSIKPITGGKKFEAD